MSASLRGVPPVRGTQSIVTQMAWVWQRPTLVLVEIVWRWFFGLPFLWICWHQAQHILAAQPRATENFIAINPQNPWVAVSQLTSVCYAFLPHIVATLCWLAPLAAIVWSILSGAGRAILLHRMCRHVRFRPLSVSILQATWLLLLAALSFAWFRSLAWVAATHIAISGEPDLIGYAIWAIFLSLGFFILWALISWPFSIAPVLMLHKDCSPAMALARSFRLGKTFSAKLIETNLVMGIVKLALIVLAMVLSAAPLPFSDQLGPAAMHIVGIAAIIFYCIASDYFHVVRMKSLIEFWNAFQAGK